MIRREWKHIESWWRKPIRYKKFKHEVLSRTHGSIFLLLTFLVLQIYCYYCCYFIQLYWKLGHLCTDSVYTKVVGYNSKVLKKQYFTPNKLKCKQSISTLNFTCIAPVIYWSMPWNQEMKENFHTATLLAFYILQKHLNKGWIFLVIYHYTPFLDLKLCANQCHSHIRSSRIHHVVGISCGLWCKIVHTKFHKSVDGFNISKPNTQNDTYTACWTHVFIFFPQGTNVG